MIKLVRLEDLAHSVKPLHTSNLKAKLKNKEPHPLFIQSTHNDRLQSITDRGSDLIFDPPGDGNCQFSALAFALSQVNIYRSAETLRSDVITYLREHDQLPDGYPIQKFLVDMSWEEYLNMSTDGIYGDEITLLFLTYLT